MSFVFENPLYRAQRKIESNGKSSRSGMSTKDFLSAIPSFSAFSDEQLSTLEKRAIEQKFAKGVRV